jgi:hypothetical protein
MARGVSYRGAMRPLLLVALLALLAACAADPTLTARDCTPGTTAACACVGGATGAQTCTAAGTVGACVCPDAGGADVVAVVDAPAADLGSLPDVATGPDVVDAGGADVVDAADAAATCDGSCPPRPNAITLCVGGVCSVVMCRAGYANCDGDESNGCEVNFTTDPAHCGRCGNVCAAGQECALERCIAACAPGVSRCRVTPTFEGVCTDLQNDSTNCGMCGRACQFPHAAAACLRGQCVIGSCNPGYGNCDNDLTNGCECMVRGDAGR